MDDDDDYEYNDDNENIYMELIYTISSGGSLNRVKYLVKNGADIHKNNEQALREAVIIGNIDIVAYLVDECKANIHAYDDAVFKEAIKSGFDNIVEYLINKGANIHNHIASLEIAASKGFLGTIRLFVNNGMNIHVDDDELLYIATKYNRLNIVEYILELGNMPQNIRDEALRLAAAHNRLDIVKYLIENGYSYAINNALHTALVGGQISVVNYLRNLIQQQTNNSLIEYGGYNPRDDPGQSVVKDSIIVPGTEMQKYGLFTHLDKYLKYKELEEQKYYAENPLVKQYYDNIKRELEEDEINELYNSVENMDPKIAKHIQELPYKLRKSVLRSLNSYGRKRTSRRRKRTSQGRKRTSRRRKLTSRRRKLTSRKKYKK